MAWVVCVVDFVSRCEDGACVHEVLNVQSDECVAMSLNRTRPLTNEELLPIKRVFYILSQSQNNTHAHEHPPFNICEPPRQLCKAHAVAMSAVMSKN